MTEDDKKHWREKLTAQQYNVCWNKATEPPFTGKYTDCEQEGIYYCVCCSNPLFDSANKYHSGCGWPSFWDVIGSLSVEEVADHSHGMVRTEVVCGGCHAHLGHVFKDGPKPSGLRYCINSAALEFRAHHE